jgi:hypothetical protein
MQNKGNKTIVAVHWAYLFYPKDPREALAYVFNTKTNIGPGKEKNVTDQVPSVTNQKSPGKVPTAYNRALFEERVVILRLDYADGSSWQSSGGTSGSQKSGP